MRIHNFRAGFATNSSSSHSVVLIPSYMIGRVRHIDANYPDNFGWDKFRLVSEESKLRYLAAQLYANYASQPDALTDILSRMDNEIVGYAENIEKLKESGNWEDEPGVDHQSVLKFPQEYSGEFVENLINHFKSPRIVVVGGNDNEDCSDIQISDSQFIEYYRNIKDSRSDVKMRRDGTNWIMFDNITGNKMRFTFDNEDMEAHAYTKSIIPELIDVKITNWCDTGCAFCYQSSTIKGKHAPFERIAEIARMMGEMGVFEVAIGGGEPTAHPDFTKILYAFKDAGVVANFTTLSSKWLDSDEIVKAVCETVGGIGVSCIDANSLELATKIQNTLKNSDYDYPKIMVQHVIGSVPLQTTIDFIKEAADTYLPILLLGYKEVGFGKKFQRFDDESLEVVLKLTLDKQFDYLSLSVDTALIDQYPSLPKILGAPDALVSSPEGKFSCYIDAITNRMGASSYVQSKEMLPLILAKDDFLEKFAKF